MRDFLLEIGVEEIPAPHLGPATDFLKSSFIKLMESSGLSFDALSVSSTPRRFYVLASSVQEMQADIRVKKTGPAKQIAYDESGKLLPAALGFLKKNKASEQDIYIEKTDKGEFIALDYTLPGRATQDILRDWILDIIHQIPFAKSMIWNDSRLAFSRPLRWLCVLWGPDVIELTVSGVSSGRQSRGNRWLGLDRRLDIPEPRDYLEILRENAVLADRRERRETISQGLQNAFPSGNHAVIKDERLIDTVTDLVENPNAVVAEFQAEYLDIPEKIITSTISQNQKCFSVRDGQGKLSNKFVFISNGDAAHAGLIRKGNEKVVNARLADALWYFKEDTRVPLETYVPRLEEVVFQSQLGSMAARTKRIEELSSLLCNELGLDREQSKLVARTAQLCKADLVTNMLGEKEFTKLQGYIGKHYALASGEHEEVAEGIYEHYMPRGNNDSLPQTVTGAVVAVADKLDSVCGIIGVGLVPTGSADPFALRRAANGVVQILADKGWEVELSLLIEKSLQRAGEDAELKSNSADTARSFFRQRVNWLLTQLNLDYDVIDSVMHLSLGSIPDLKRRAIALQQFREQEEFKRLVIGFKRVANILEDQKEFPPLNENLLNPGPETELFVALKGLRTALTDSLARSDHKAAISLLVQFGDLIDRFFDAVLVNCDDLQLRSNRHSLLNLVKQEFLRVADISKIVIESE